MILAFVKLFQRVQKRINGSPTIEAFNPIITDLELQLNPAYNEEKYWGYRPTNMIDKLIVHQELGEGDTKSVHRYQTSINSHLKIGVGAPMIAYHYTIEKDGTIYKVNKDTDITWHTKGQNMVGIGIMLVGDFTGPDHIGQSEPTDRQLSALKYLLNKLRLKYGLEKADVYGHNDFGKKACPGDIVVGFLDNYKGNKDIRV
jgi:N-acetylmuramoyl-L-alanine amidase